MFSTWHHTSLACAKNPKQISNPFASSNARSRRVTSKSRSTGMLRNYRPRGVFSLWASQRCSTVRKSTSTLTMFAESIFNGNDVLMASYSTQQNSTGSPLMRLPSELRTDIFEYVLLRNEPIDLFTMDSMPRNTREPEGASTLPHVLVGSYVPRTLSFLLVCRQIYGEAATMLYARNSFRIR